MERLTLTKNNTKITLKSLRGWVSPLLLSNNSSFVSRSTRYKFGLNGATVYKKLLQQNECEVE